MIVKSILESKQFKYTQKVYLMTSSKKLFYSQVDFKEVYSQSLLVREIEITSWEKIFYTLDIFL